MSEEAVLQRLTAILLVLGGILVLVGTILVPRADDPGAVASVLAAYSGDEGSARVGTLAGSVGIWALVLGFANVHHFIGSGSRCRMGPNRLLRTDPWGGWTDRCACCDPWNRRGLRRLGHVAH